MQKLIDFSLSVLGLLILLPIFAAVALCIVIEDGRPIFFRQIRVGLKGRPFKIWKFRTMRSTSLVGPSITATHDDRITKVGRYLRKLKIDELPQLINVIIGEMSLVGPRPEVPKYVALYSSTQRQVLDVLPGITAPASLKYSNEGELLAKATNPEEHYIQVLMPDKIKIDIEYNQRRTWRSDLGLIFKTVSRVWS